MSKFATCLYSEPQILTRRAVFFQLCGENSIPQYKHNLQSDYVFLNFCDDLYLASSCFDELKKENRNVIVYSDVPLQTTILSYLNSYEKCSLIVCPKEYEIEEAGNRLRKGGVYKTVAATLPDSLKIPQIGGTSISLTKAQRQILFYICCGMPQKIMAAEMGTSEKSVAKTVSRLKEIFGDCQTTEQLLANASLLL